MLPSSGWRAWLVVLGCAACQLDGSIGRAETGGLGETSEDDELGTAAAFPDGSEEDGGGSGGAGASGGSDGAGGSGSDGAAASTGGMGEDTGAPQACLAAPEDTVCTACRKASCCELLDTCLAHDTCTCTWHCVAEGLHTLEECALGCGDDGVVLSDLHDCAGAHCTDECTSPLDDAP